MNYHIPVGMYRKIFQILLVLYFAPALIQVANAQDKAENKQSTKENNPYFNNSGLPLPRYISLASGKVFMRSGPGLRYPIKWIYTKKGLPIEVVQEFDTWRKIRDYEGDEGWVHQSLLSGRRSAVVKNDKSVMVYKKDDLQSQNVILVEPLVVLPLDKCSKSWCKVEIQGFNGWVEKKFLWGVYEQEEFD